MSAQVTAIFPCLWHPGTQQAQQSAVIRCSASWAPVTGLLMTAEHVGHTGVGGPTGCKEAWATLIQQDQDLPGVLVHIFSIRKHSKVDRDIIVFVAGNVS